MPLNSQSELLYPYRRSPDQDRALSAPARKPVIIVGAGPIGLTVAIDLALKGIPVVILDEAEGIGVGSRAICFSRRTLEILSRLGCGDQMLEKGVQWNTGRVFRKDRQIYEFNLSPEQGFKHPAFINLQQYYMEGYLAARVQELAARGATLDLRGGNKVTALECFDDYVSLEITTPDGPYTIEADWLIACDGPRSTIRSLMQLDFKGRVFEDNFLIADVVMKADFPTERWFWFDPPFNPGQSALLHKQPDNVWRIDFQLGWDIDREAVIRPENVIPRIEAMLGPDVTFELEWVSVYTFQCCSMQRYRHNRVLFAGDSAHQVSPFGARGANGGVQDADNLAWKLALVIAGKAPAALLDSYDSERRQGADENILNSTRATDFITPKSPISRLFRDAVLDLVEQAPFARPLVNSGRLSVPAIYDESPLNGADDPSLPTATRPGAPLVDLPLPDALGSWLLKRAGGRFQLLVIDHDIPAKEPQGDTFEVSGIDIAIVRLSTTNAPLARPRYLGNAASAVYLIRPDQHVAARWTSYNRSAITAALHTAIATVSEPLSEPA